MEPVLARWLLRRRLVRLAAYLGGVAIVVVIVLAEQQAYTLGAVLAIGAVFLLGLGVMLRTPVYVRHIADIDRVDARGDGLFVTMENCNVYKVPVSLAERRDLELALERASGAARLSARVVHG